LINKKYDQYIYSIILSIMIRFNAFIMGGWVRDVLKRNRPTDVDMYICSNRGFLSEFYAYFESISRKLFRHLHGGQSFKIIIEHNSTYPFYRSSKYHLINGTETIVILDINTYRKSNPPYSTIDFLQNCLVLYYRKHVNNVMLTTLCDWTWYSNVVHEYINNQPINKCVSMCVGMMLDCPLINDTILSFLGTYNWKLVYGVMYSILTTNDMFACHMHCNDDQFISNSIQFTNCAIVIKNRCKKFRNRRFTLCNLKKCNNPMCIFSKASTTSTSFNDEYNQNRQNTLTYIIDITNYGETGIVYTQNRYYPGSVESEKTQLYDDMIDYYDWTYDSPKYKKGKSKSIQKQKYRNVQHLTNKQERAYTTMCPKMGDRAFNKMLGINLVHKNRKIPNR